MMYEMFDVVFCFGVFEFYVFGDFWLQFEIQLFIFVIGQLVQVKLYCLQEVIGGDIMFDIFD